MAEVTTLIDDLDTFSSIISSELAAAGASPTPPPNANNSPFDNNHASSREHPYTYPTPFVSQLGTPANTNTSQSSHSPNSHSPPTHQSPQSQIPSLLPPHFLTFSSLILVYDLYCCPEDLLTGGPGSGGETPKTASSLAIQGRAVAGIRSTALAVRDAGVELLEFVMLPANLEKVGPLVLDALYAAMATLHWLWKEGGEEGIGAALEDVKRVLARLDMRWRLARDYLGLERYHDVTTIMEMRAR
jgi:hypothetical protein